MAWVIFKRAWFIEGLHFRPDSRAQEVPDRFATKEFLPSTATVLTKKEAKVLEKEEEQMEMALSELDPLTAETGKKKG